MGFSREPLSILCGTALGNTAVSHTKFQENPFNGSSSVRSGHTGGYDEDRTANTNTVMPAAYGNCAGKLIDLVLLHTVIVPVS
jgi:hypothetical protein